MRSDGGLESIKGYTTAPFGVGPSVSSAASYQRLDLGVVVNRTMFYNQTGPSAGNTTVNAYDTSLTNPATNVLGVITGTAPWSTDTIFFPTLPNAAGTDRGASHGLIICTGAGGPYVATATTLTDYSVTPTASPAWASVAKARWCKVVNNVLWFAGFPTAPNQVVGMKLNAPLVNPGYSTFVMTNPVTGLGVYGEGLQAALAVGMTSGLSLIYGTNPGSYSAQDIPYEDGPVSGLSMVNYNGMLFFLGNQNIYQFAGQSPDPTFSKSVEPIIQGSFNTLYPLLNTDKSTVWSFQYNNRLHFVYDSLGSGKTNTILVFDLLVGGWSIIQTYDSISGFGQDPIKGQTYIVTGPAAGTQPVVIWDRANATTGNASWTTDANPVTTNFTSKYFKLGVPGTQKTLYRASPEIFYTRFQGLFGAINNYGRVNQQVVITASTIGAAAQFDVAQFDQAVFGGGILAFTGPPDTRVDFDQLTGEAFALTMQTLIAQPPFIFAGVSGQYRIRGVP